MLDVKDLQAIEGLIPDGRRQERSDLHMTRGFHDVTDRCGSRKCAVIF
jgi:hypothetical protein